MGQHEKSDSEHALELLCGECGDTFWTDTTQSNDCPECGFMSMTPAGGNADKDMRRR